MTEMSNYSNKNLYYIIYKSMGILGFIIISIFGKYRIIFFILEIILNFLIEWQSNYVSIKSLILLIIYFNKPNYE